MGEIPGAFAALAAGLLSFLSPCVLPLVPSYLAMLAGTTVRELRGVTGGVGGDEMASGNEIDTRGHDRGRSRVFVRSIAFVAGFSVVFMVLGLAFSRATAMIGGTSRTIALIAGAVVILLGLNILFDFFKVLNLERRFRLGKRPQGFFSAFLFGAAFGAGWSPCVGPMLASILLLAGRGSTAKAATLLGVYSLGLGLPFLAAGFFFGKIEGVMVALKRRMREVKIVSGLLLVLIGLSMIGGDFTRLSGQFARLGYAIQAFTESHAGTYRILSTMVYGAIAALFFPFVFFRGKRGSTAKRAVAAGIALAAAALACLEALGAFNSARLLASWLLFQGI
jgi:cytochrome c-type biogenesis protein